MWLACSGLVRHMQSTARVKRILRSHASVYFIAGVTAAGKAMLESDTVRKIGFTGSTPVGKQLMAGAADTVKRVSLELVGSTPCGGSVLS